MTSIRVGVIGAGWGMMHAMAVKDLDPNFHLTALWSRSKKHRETARTELGLDVRAIEASWEDLICRPDIDIVVVAAPDYLHYPIILKALRMGKHVLCEKPLATNEVQARKILRATEETKIHHFIGFNWRFAPPFATLKRLIDEGAIGTPIYFDGQFRIGPPKASKEWQFSRRGGVFSNTMIHLIDLVRYFAATDIRSTSRLDVKDDERVKSDPNGQKCFKTEQWRVWAHGDSPIAKVHTEKEPIYRLSWLHFESRNTGIKARLQASQDWTVRTSDPLRIEVHGTEASIIGYANPLDPSTQRVVLVPRISFPSNSVSPLDFPGGPPDTVSTSTDSAVLRILLPSVRHLYKRHVYPIITGSGEAVYTPNFYDGMAAQCIVEAALRSVVQGGWCDTEVR